MARCSRRGVPQRQPRWPPGSQSVVRALWARAGRSGGFTGRTWEQDADLPAKHCVTCRGLAGVEQAGYRSKPLRPPQAAYYQVGVGGVGGQPAWRRAQGLLERTQRAAEPVADRLGRLEGPGVAERG